MTDRVSAYIDTLEQTLRTMTLEDRVEFTRCVVQIAVAQPKFTTVALSVVTLVEAINRE